MAENTKAIRVGEERYADLMKTLDTSFSFFEEGKQFIDLLPKLYKKEYTPWKNNICVLDGGTIASGVGLYYSEYTVCGKTLPYGGIGNVAVLPEFRRKGYMKACMSAAMAEMKQNGTVFCVLDGQRQRYQYFGFDNVGCSYLYHVTKTNLRHAFGERRSVSVTSEPVLPEDGEALDYIFAENEKRPVHTRRRREELYDILLSWFAKPYKLVRNGEIIGYYVLGNDRKSVHELTVRHMEDLADCVICIVDSLPASAAFSYPPYMTDYCDFLFGICDWMDVKGSGKIAVLNYRKTLDAFLRAKALEHPLPDEDFTVLIHGIAGDENLHIQTRNGAVLVEETAAAAMIELSHLEAEAFFFGNYSAARRQLSRAGAGLLPLPFFLFSQDHV